MFRKISFFLILILSVACNADKTDVKGPTPSLDAQLRKYPDSIPLLNERAHKSFENFKFQQGLKDAAHSFRLDSSNYESRLLYAQGLINQSNISNQDFFTSQYHFAMVLKKEPKNLEALIGLANTMAKIGDNEKAFKLINRALRINPKYRDAYILKGSIYRLIGNAKLTKSSYQTAIQQDPEFYGGYIMLGAIYESERNPICLEYYITACKLRPKDPDPLYSLAYAKYQFGQLKEAKRIYRKMLGLDSSYFEADFQLGYIKQFDELELDSAMHFYGLVLEQAPNHIPSLHNIGLLYEDKKDWANALINYARVLKIDPDYKLTLDRVKFIKPKL